jgi:Family of unknown function (DUF6519)
MKGDFSRITFDVNRGYSAVLLQQGRVQLDADWNEQGAIVTEAIRALARDLLGPHCGSEEGFKLSPVLDGPRPDMHIGVGWYYVDGIRCENRAMITITGQRGFPFGPEDESTKTDTAIGYLDVWERHVTAIEDPSIREVALGGPDTATRARVSWRVRLLSVDPAAVGRKGSRAKEVLDRAVPGIGRSFLRARAGSPGETGYTGLENQLYRIEVHKGGEAGTATFKWSRDNGSVASPAWETSDGTIRIDPLVLRPGRRFEPGDWLEPADDGSALRAEAPPMVRVESVDDDTVRVSGSRDLPLDTSKHPLVRRWDHGTAGSPELEGAIALAEDRWVDLERGVQIWFEGGGSYRTGDYWVIPAHPATGDVEWPCDVDGPIGRSPAGVRHHAAPLALLRLSKAGRVSVVRDLRRVCRNRGCT